METEIAQGQKIQADNFSTPVLPGADNKNLPTQSSCIGQSQVMPVATNCTKRPEGLTLKMRPRPHKSKDAADVLVCDKVDTGE